MVLAEVADDSAPKRTQDTCWCDNICNYTGALNDDSTHLCSGYNNGEDDYYTTEHDDSDLSYVGKATYEILRTKHTTTTSPQNKQQQLQQRRAWNLSSGRIVGKLHQTPRDAFRMTNTNTLSLGGTGGTTLSDGHDDWFPEIIANIMKRTQVWCDVCSLSPPDGLFLEKFKEALAVIAKTSITKSKTTSTSTSRLLSWRSSSSSSTSQRPPPPIVVRLLFANIIGVPLNCNAILNELTSHLPKDANLHVWVGS